MTASVTCSNGYEPNTELYIDVGHATAAQCGLIDRRLDDGKLVCGGKQISEGTTEGARAVDSAVLSCRAWPARPACLHAAPRSGTHNDLTSLSSAKQIDDDLY